MGDLDSAGPLRKELEPQISLEKPRLYIIWLLSLARILQKWETHQLLNPVAEHHL